MHVYDNHLAVDLAKKFIGFAKRIVVVLHEYTALEIDDSVTLAGFSCAFIGADSGNALSVVGWTKHAARAGISVGRVKVIHDLPLVPDVIAGSEHVATQVQEFFSNRSCETKAACSIFGISNHQIDLVRGYKVRKVVVDYLASSAAENVTDEEDLHESLILPAVGDWQISNWNLALGLSPKA